MAHRRDRALARSVDRHSVHRRMAVAPRRGDAARARLHGRARARGWHAGVAGGGPARGDRRDEAARRGRRRGAETVRQGTRRHGSLLALGRTARRGRAEPARTPMNLPTVVTTEWLAAHLGEPDLRVIDATWYLPVLKRDAGAEYLTAHVPGAVYFDIDAVKDTSNPLPHMLPEASGFAAAVGALEIGDGDRVVVYGQKYLIASARVWWSFRVFGHDRVAVLDGGLPKWKAEGRPVEAGAVTPPPRRFTARARPELVRDLARMRANVDSRREQVVDARSLTAVSSAPSRSRAPDSAADASRAASACPTTVCLGARTARSRHRTRSARGSTRRMSTPAGPS